MALTFTSDDLANAKAALTSGAMEVQIGDRRVKYRSQNEILELIAMIEDYLNGVDSTTDNPRMIQAGFSRGEK